MTHDFDKALEAMDLWGIEPIQDAKPNDCLDYLTQELPTIRHALSMAKVTEDWIPWKEAPEDFGGEQIIIAFESGVAAMNVYSKNRIGGAMAFRRLPAYEAALSEKGVG